MTNLKLRTWMFLRRNLWHRFLDEIHVEAAYSDSAFKALSKYTSDHTLTNLMFTCPTQDLWQRLRIQADGVDEADYVGVVADRYQRLTRGRTFTPFIGVHVHLFGPHSVRIPSFEEQLGLISEAKEWFKRYYLPTDDFAPGWNRYNANTIRACEELGFKRFHVSQVRNGCEKSESLGFVMVYNVSHDWSLK